MRLTPPFPLSTIAQNFGDNAVSLYTEGLGLKGHPGIDFSVPWGTAIPCSTDSYCYSVVTNPNPAFYQAVYTIFDDVDGNSYEISYGHCSTISAEPNRPYDTGVVLAQVGNTGSVFANGKEVTTDEKLTGSRAGSHLHFQVRLLKKVPLSFQDPAKHYINNGSGLYVKDGFIYEVPLWNNGYAGCISPQQFFTDDTDLLKSEIQVLNQTQDPSVRQAFTTLIANLAKKILGI